MNKKLFALLLVVLLTLTACSTNASQNQSASGNTVYITNDQMAAIPTATTAPDLFVFTRENFPRMDGSTSTVPLGQAVASVLLGESREAVAELAIFNKTTQSFLNLMNGKCDILIVGEPNASVFDEMKKADFKYELSPIATDALVFIVNENNPVSNLTTEQVQKIYAGEITNWKEVGGDDLKIEAFQRNKDAGSQALMEKLVMSGKNMMDPPERYAIGEMGGLITAVKNFDGTNQAIGYTVYYYAEDMKMAKGLKILAIDGVTPSDETIQSKKYPFLNPYYAVIAAKEAEDSPARIMYNWLLSPEGQKLIKTEGYVPVR